MKLFNLLALLILLILLTYGNLIQAQQKEVVPDLSKIKQTSLWTTNTRVTASKGEVHFSKNPGNELVVLNDLTFENGTIEVDIRGKDEQGASFVGIAFHILNDSTYDAVYFRAFNFRNAERKNHAVQYISHPQYPWDRLRKESYGVYENTVDPVPDPNDWFHATIVVEYPWVKVFVNHAEDPSLEVKQLSDRKQGRLGLWVPDISGGSFKNLKITLADKGASVNK